MGNQKEINYCLRHHTQATLRYLGLKDITPRLKPDQYESIIHEGWAGLVPKLKPELELPAYIGVVYMKDYQ